MRINARTLRDIGVNQLDNKLPIFYKYEDIDVGVKFPSAPVTPADGRNQQKNQHKAYRDNCLSFFLQEGNEGAKKKTS